MFLRPIVCLHCRQVTFKHYCVFLGRGYEVSVKSSKSVQLFEFGKRNCDHVLVLSSEAVKWPSRTVAQDFVDFVNGGGNVMLTASSNSTAQYRDFVAEFGFEIPEAVDNRLIDYFAVDGELDAVSVKKTAVQSVPQIVSEPFAFSGAAHTLFEDNALVFSVVSASASSALKSADPGYPFAGSDLKLVSALQGRNNARVTLIGSHVMLNDDFMSKNEKFANQLTAWTFQESCILRVAATHHHLTSDNVKREWYRIKDSMMYEVVIEEYVKGAWAPFSVPAGDQMQLELVMLDPYVRVNLKSNNSAGMFVTPADFRLPDKHGIFTLKVEYKRRGYSHISEKSTISIVPLRHNDVKRFLVAAYPYYISSAVMISAFLSFCLIYLFGNYTGEKVKSS